MKFGALTFVGASAGTYMAMKSSPWFNKAFSVSAKASIPVMTGIAMWSLGYELTMNNMNRMPEKYGLPRIVELDGEESMYPILAAKPSKNTPLHHRVANAFYGNFIK